MYNIAIVGDVHIDTKVSSRKDDYFQTCLNKITDIAKTSKNIIFLGDVFNRPTIPNEYFTRLYIHLNYLKNKGNNFYSIVGNHDIFNEDEESLPKTSLGLCELTGIIKLITPDNPITIDSRTFYTTYVNFNKAKQHIKTLKLSSSDVLLLHHFYEDTSSSFSYSDLCDIGCENIFLGHEHLPLPALRKILPKFTIFRCGSLLRNIANAENLNRDIYYFVFDNEIKPYMLENVKPAQEVFTEKAFTQENLSRKNFVKNINDVILKYTNNINTESKFSIKNILMELKTPQPNMDYIEAKYSQINEVFS